MKLYKLPKVPLKDLERQLPTGRIVLYEMFDSSGRQLATLDGITILEEMYIKELLKLEEVKQWIIIDTLEK
jgi:hypothetical protein